MRNTFFRRQSTHLNYNAPTISIAIQPTDATVSNGNTATFTGIATVQFNSADNSGSGSFSYQWYEGTSPVVSSGNITVTGAATTVLTIDNPINPDDDERQFYLKHFSLRLTLELLRRIQLHLHQLTMLIVILQP